MVQNCISTATLIYRRHLEKWKAAGGKVTMPKTKINDEIGSYMAFFTDTEGNGVAALHSSSSNLRVYLI